MHYLMLDLLARISREIVPEKWKLDHPVNLYSKYISTCSAIMVNSGSTS